MAKTTTFTDANRTTSIPNERMTLVVTKKDNGGARLELIQHGTSSGRGIPFPKIKTAFFLDNNEVTELVKHLA